jgi:hypothetical protein
LQEYGSANLKQEASYITLYEKRNKESKEREREVKRED